MNRQRPAVFGRTLPSSTGAVLGIALLAALPLLSVDDTFLQYLDLFLIYGIVVMGLNLQQGYAGIVNLGPSATFGVGAYAAAVISHHLHWPMPLPFVGPLAVAFLCANLFGGGALVLSKFHFTMLSFYSALLIPILAEHGGFFTGGNTGLADVEPLELAGIRPTGAVLYAVLAGLFLIAYWVMVSIVRSRWGLAYLALKDDELAASVVGIAPRETKFGVIMIGTLYAVLAGGLFVTAWPGNCLPDVPSCVINPNFFGFQLSVLLFAAVTIGGAGTPIGPLAGTALLVAITWYFQNHDNVPGDWQEVIYGALLVLVVVALPRGLASFGRLAETRPEAVPAARYTAPHLPRRTRPASRLAARGITAAFGGVVALDAVDFDVSPGEIAALIGPNGSGKTTLLNCFSGIVVPRSGEVLLDGVRLPPVPLHRAYRRARAGIARTFQTPRVQPELSVLDNVVQGLFWRGSRLDGMRVPHRRGRQRAREQRARVLLRAVGLEHRAQLPAVALSHGERRLLEVARALVGEPGVVLLDEPAAGLSAEESRHLVEVLRACRKWGCATVLIEHDLSLVLEVGDSVTVLDRGRVIARGTPAEVRAAPVVAEAFMGPVG